MKTVIMTALLVALSGCGPAYPGDQNRKYNDASDLCVPHLIAVAEDGTKLWKVDAYECPYIENHVFFSSSGTQTDELHHKIIVPVQVPNTRHEGG